MALRYLVIRRPREQQHQWAVELVRDDGKEMPMKVELSLASFKERRHAEMFQRSLEIEGISIELQRRIPV